MKRLTTLFFALAIGFVSFAQKNEIKAIEKALKSDNFANAKTMVNAAENLLSSMDDKTKAKFYFLKAKTMYANGTGINSDLKQTVEALDNLKDLESKMGKLKYTQEANEMKQKMLEGILQNADEQYAKKNFSVASKGFYNAYKLTPKDTTLLYYAATAAVQDQDYDTSLGYYEELKNLGYKGIVTNYFATNVETNEEETFPNKDSRDIAVRSKEYINPTSKKTSSRYPEIVKNIALIYVNKGDNEKGLASIKDARKANPEDLGLMLSEADVQLKMGNKEKFTELMAEASKKDPNNAELQYNLGVMAAEGGNAEAARKHYEKAIELDPTYANAYSNMVALILESEKDIVEEMNGLGNSSADNRRYDELRSKRTELYESAIPYLLKVMDLNKKDIDTARTLMNIYSIIGETDKFKAMKSKIEELEANSGN